MMPSTSARASGSSEDEADKSLEMNGESRKARRRRGRRTRKKSERGDSPASEINQSPARTPLEHRKRTCSLGAPPAPRNTNDFLLEDMEKREEDGAKRVRREELESAIHSQVEGREPADSELNGEDEFDDQYEESWQECVVDKYKEMSHDELARRMAAMEKNRDEVERKLRWERSKSDYLQERLLEAEEAIREQRDASPFAPPFDRASAESPPPPVPTPQQQQQVPLSSCGLPSGMLLGNCSPNVISSPRA